MDSFKADGLLGLSPIRKDNPGQHLFVNELMVDGRIDNAIFSIYLADDKHQSGIIFGGYDPEIIAESKEQYGNDLFWMSINSDKHWQVPLVSITIADQQPIKSAASNVFFNTGTSTNFVPKADLDKIISKIREKTTCEADKDNQDAMSCKCDVSLFDEKLKDVFPVLTFELGKSEELCTPEEETDPKILDLEKCSTVKDCTLNSQCGPNESCATLSWTENEKSETKKVCVLSAKCGEPDEKRRRLREPGSAKQQ